MSLFTSKDCKLLKNFCKRDLYMKFPNAYLISKNFDMVSYSSIGITIPKAEVVLPVYNIHGITGNTVQLSKYFREK